MDIQMLRKAAVLNGIGRGHSSLYSDIAKGLMTKGVAIGSQAVAWPDYEVKAIITARIAGKSDDEIRALVAELHERRKVAA